MNVLLILLKSEKWKRSIFNVVMKHRNVGTILRHFQHFSSLKTFCFMLESKVLISDVCLYPLHAKDIKCNVNPLTPNQITLFLADMKKK